MSSDNLNSCGYMTLSMLGFVLNDLLLKSLGDEMGFGQIILLRGSILCVVLVVILMRAGLIRQWHALFSAGVLIRSMADAVATVFFLTALLKLPFANIAALLQSLPLAVTCGAALFFGAAVGWRRWLAIVIGFAGVLLIIRPGMQGFNPTSLLVLAVVFFAAIRDLVTSRLPATLPSLLVTFATVVVTTLMGLVFALGQGNWQPVSSQQLLFLALAALCLFVAHYFVILAMRTGEIAYVSPFRYSSLVFAIALAYVFFGEVPDLLTIVGSLIIVGTGLYALYRETRLQRG